MPPETELIKQQMGQTRSALTEKLEALETKISGTLDSAAVNVGQTVQEIGSAVRETAESFRAATHETVSAVRDTLNVSRQVQHHPWLMLGGSVFAGYVAGLVLDNLERGRRISLPAPPAVPEQPLHLAAEERERIQPEPPPRRRAVGFLRELADTFAPELRKLKAAGIGMALALVRDRLNETVPPQMREDVREMMDRITVKLGGEPHPPGAMYGRGEGYEEGDGARRAQTMGMG